MLRSVALRLGSQGRRAAGLPAVRHYADGAVAAAPQRAVVADFDWDEVSKKVFSDDGKRELQMLRSIYLDMKATIDAANKPLPKIDFSFYRKEVHPEMVDLFERMYSAVMADLPHYDASKDVQAAEATFAGLVQQAKELSAYSAKRQVEIEQELKDLDQARAKIRTATIDEELARDPETAKEIDREIAAGNYMP